MNVLSTTWRQLVRRRLWPLAVLLIAALVAVPVLLARDATPVDTPALPETSAPAETAAADDDALAEPVVAKASAADRSRRRRVLGSRKNPFEPAPVKKPKAKKSTESEQPKDTGGTDAPKRHVDVHADRAGRPGGPGRAEEADVSEWLAARALRRSVLGRAREEGPAQARRPARRHDRDRAAAHLHRPQGSRQEGCLPRRRVARRRPATAPASRTRAAARRSSSPPARPSSST